MTQTITRPRTRGIQGFLDNLREGPTVDVDPSAIAPEPTPPQSMQGMLGALSQTTTQSAGTSLTMESLERIVQQVSGSTIQSESNQLATEMQLRREATRQIDQGVQEANQAMDSVWFNGTNLGIPSVRPTPVPISPKDAKKLFPKDKDWEKLYRSRKPVEEKISHILIHSQDKITEVQETLDVKETIQRDIRKGVRKAQTQVKEMERDIRELKKRKKELENETEEKKELRAAWLIHDVLALPKVRKIEVDEKKRIFITTDEMEVMKDYWDKPRVAGQYQILVDFYETNIKQGIRVLNITRRFMDQYDHPCINHTNPCWGNIEKEMNEGFKERDLLEIVITMLLYISSPNDDTGWIEYSKKLPTERHKQGWEQFLEFATPCPKKFSFRKYEKQQAIGNQSVSLTPTGLAYPQTSGGMASIAQFVAPQPSRLPPLVIGEEHFEDRFIEYLNRLVEFRDEDMRRVETRRMAIAIEHANFIFIKEIEYMADHSLRIRGWGPSGERQQIYGFVSELITHVREANILRFDPPSWFRDVGRPGIQYFDQEERQRVPVMPEGTITTTGGTGAYYTTIGDTTGGSI